MDEREEELHRCARTGNLSRMKFLMLEKEVDVNCADPVGRTALHRAAIAGQAKAVEILLENGAKVDLKTKTGETALMFTCLNLSKETFDTLLRSGADPNLENDAGMTPKRRLETSLNPKSKELYQMLPTKEDEKEEIGVLRIEEEHRSEKDKESTPRPELVKIALPHPTVHKGLANLLFAKLEQSDNPHEVAKQALLAMQEILYDLCLDNVDIDLDTELSDSECEGETCLRLLSKGGFIPQDSKRKLVRCMSLLWQINGILILRDCAKEIIRNLDEMIQWAVQLH
uniref:Uncharacterized protein n=1 Tax=Picocystis salinarum TaxID=88271 RepID=A0A6U9PWG1_9CHLO